MKISNLRGIPHTVPSKFPFNGSRSHTRINGRLRWRQALKRPQLLLFLLFVVSLSNLQLARFSNITRQETSSFSNLLADVFLPKSSAMGLRGWFRNGCRVDNITLSDLLEEIPLGVSKLPQWLRDICPEVVEHFEMFPAFERSFAWIVTTIINDRGVASVFRSKLQLPILTTQAAVQGVCTIKMAQKIAATINEDLVLYAGSQMGALYHGQPMLWDDDFDAVIPFHKRYDFLNACENAINITEGVTLHCHKYHKALKVWLQGPTSVKTTPRRFTHWYPFLDIFFLTSNSSHIYQTQYWSDVDLASTTMKVSDFFPLQSYYFGGISVVAGNAKSARAIYGEQSCFLSSHNHRLEETGPLPLRPVVNRRLDCCRLSTRFPFLYESTKLFNGQTLKQLPAPSRERITSPNHEQWVTNST